MRAIDGIQDPSRSPFIVGSGLIALDLVLNHENQPAYMRAGGTCGNVLTILSYLGWNSFPIGRLADDEASALIFQDLKMWDVHVDFLALEPRTPAPLIVQRIRHDSTGLPHHTYSRNCPLCGSWLPGYRPVSGAVAESIIDRLPRASVFFFDRVSRGMLLLAQSFAKRGAIVVFEPSAVGDPQLFAQAFSVAHIVKYAEERRATLDVNWPTEHPLLEIETLGKEGLRYRSRLQLSQTTEWVHITPYRSYGIRDTSGAGDWCTAGILSLLATSGIDGFMSTSLHQIEQAMSFSQALSAWSCRFEGARGGMYQTSKRQFSREIASIIADGAPELPNSHSWPGIGWTQWQHICPCCKDRVRPRSESNFISMSSPTA